MIYTVKRSTPTKIAYFAFVLLLAFMLVIGTPCMEVKAFAPALVLAGVAIPEAVTIGGALLAAAGLTFAGDYAIDSAVNWFYSNAAPSLREAFVSACGTLSNGIVSVGDELWNGVQGWVNGTFVQGLNQISNTLHTLALGGQQIPYSFNAAEAYSIGNSVTIGGDTFSFKVYPVIPTIYATEILKNGVRVGDNVMFESTDPKVFFYYSCDSTNGLALWSYRGAGTNIRRELVQPNILPYNDPAISLTHTNFFSTTGESVVATSGYDFKTAEGRRDIAVPTTLADLVGKTYADVQNPTTPPGEMSGSWWKDLLAPIIAGVSGFAGTLRDIWAWLQEFWEKILEKMQQALQPVAQTLQDIKVQVAAKTMDLIAAITGVTDAVKTSTAEPDLDPPTRNYKLPDFVFGLFAVIKACIRLVVRACVFLATIVAIEPDGSLLNDNAVAGVNFFKNQKIPVLNVSVWTMFSSMMTLVISLSVVRKVRSTFTG